MKQTAKLSVSQQKRQAIINAARSAFQQSGVQGTSMDKLAELAQVSKRTVYNHFASKEQLVIEILSDLWQETLVLPDMHFQVEQNLTAQLNQLLLIEIELISSDEYLNLNRVALGHFLFQPEALDKALASYQPMETALARWLQGAQKAKQLNKIDLIFAYNQLHNLIKGSCFWPQVLGIAKPLDKKEQQHLAKESAQMFLSRYQK